MLHDAQRTSAPSAASVSISTAVWIVICNEPAIRAPRNGWVGPNSSRVAIRPGISVSAMAISLRPHEASPMSFTTWSVDVDAFGAVEEAVMAILGVVGKTAASGAFGTPGASTWRAYSRAPSARQSVYKDFF